jgi:copper chaperone CopZ
VLQNQDKMIHSYNIQGMTCNACVAKVKSELLKLGDVVNAEVQLQSPQATITMQKHIPIASLQQAVSKAGPYKIIEGSGMQMQAETGSDNNYLPIVLIFGYITGATLLIQWVQPSFNLMQWMQHFMAGFFLTFSFFKLMNLKGFAEGYSTYDVVAKKFYAWGFIYPFIELVLGITFLTGFNPLITNAVTLVVMGISSIGVVQSLLQKRNIQCACLGTVFKLPLGKVTLFEDALMIVMSSAMLIMIL